MSIVLENLSKRFGNNRIVDDVSLEVAEGELFVLLGASGSGKSTILRMIAGLLQPDTGRILLQNRDVTHLAPQPRGTGFVFQNYSIFRHMTVAQNIEFGLKIRRVPRDQRAQKCDELLELVNLAGLGERYAGQLSGGQQQRVALARALAYEPSVLLLDEPLGALDVKIRAQLRRSLKEVQRRLKVTTVLVTHDQDEAFELADRIGVLERGVLLEIGPPEELYTRPKTLFVASFLGAGNVVVGRTADGMAHFGTIRLPIPTDVSHEEGASAELLVRPEQVELSANEPDHDKPVLGQGEIVEDIFSGPLRRMRLRLPPLTGTRQVAPVPPFGEDGLLVDAVLPSDQDLGGGRPWVSLRGWSILEQAPPRLLVVDVLAGSTATLQLARLIAERLDGPVSVMGFDAGGNDPAQAQADFQERLTQAGLIDPDLHVRSGDFAEQLANTSAGTLFEMLIVPARFDATPAKTLDPAIVEVVAQPDIPTIVIKNELPEIRRILICTRAGEPGKTGIRIGGRLARQLGASVTLLHVTTPTHEAGRASHTHLEKAAATLRGLEVPNAALIQPSRSPAEGILQAAADHDLIVLGGHGPNSHSVFAETDVTLQVLNRSNCPVLIVPAESS